MRGGFLGVLSFYYIMEIWKSGFLTENEANEYLTNLKKQLCL